MTGWFFLSCECLDEGIGKYLPKSGLLQGPIKYDGNEHFSSIFLNEGGSAGLHLLEDCGSWHAEMAVAARRMSVSCTIRGLRFFVRWHVRAAHSCLRVKSGLGSHIFLIPHCIMRPLGCFMIDLNQISFRSYSPSKLSSSCRLASSLTWLVPLVLGIQAVL